MLLGLMLMLGQQMAAPVCGIDVETRTADEPRDSGQEVVAGGGSGANTVQGRDAHPAPVQTPSNADSPVLSAPGPIAASLHRPAPCIDLFGEACPIETALPSQDMFHWESMDMPGPPGWHRGELVLDSSPFGAEISPMAFGPDTPPPSSGDWTIDGAGNNVNNTTIVLNGNLNVTTGDLTLDNVTLIMNCTADGQYGINVSSGGVLNLTRCNITAFNGSLHYKFAVHGKMTMDRCNVSEMWGHGDDAYQGRGVALHSNGTVILSSAISNGEVTGIDVMGSAAPRIIDTRIFSNIGHGIATYDSSAAVFQNCSSTGNNWSGFSIYNTSKPTLTNCVAMDNSHGIQVADSARPKLANCSSAGNAKTGINVAGASAPVLTDCVAEANKWSGILVFGDAAPEISDSRADTNLMNGIQVVDSARPVFNNCSSTGNGICGLYVSGTSSPVFTNCSTTKNAMHGIQVSDSARPKFTGCNSTGNNQTGITIFNTTAPVLSDCVATGNLRNGIAIYGYSTPNATDLRIVDNGGTGILAAHSSKPAFSDCVSTGNSVGISVGNTSTPVFSNCQADKNEHMGIQVSDSAKPEISNSSAMGNNENGIRIYDTSAPVFTNCSAVSNPLDGVDVLDSARPVFADCLSSGNRMNGFGIGYSSVPVLRNCTATGNGLSGIAFGDLSDPVITNCTAVNNSMHGIQVSVSARGSVSNCTSAGNHLNGIAVFNLSTPVFLNCTAVNNIFRGIHISGAASPAFTRCTSNGNSASGISASETSCPVISDCVASNNSAHGFQTLDSARPKVENGTFESNGICGIGVFNTSAPAFTGCSMTANSEDAILVRHDSAPVVTQCSATNNSKYGMQVSESARPTISHCILTGNRWSGIAMFNTSAAVIRDCSISYSTDSGIVARDFTHPTVINCTSSGNGRDGLTVLESSCPRLDRLCLRDNPTQNLWVMSTEPLVLSNSSLMGGSSWDVSLSNNSRLTLLNTTYVDRRLVTGTAQLKVQWHLTFTVLDRAKKPVTGAKVWGTGLNESRVTAVPTGPDGVARDLVATEYVQNATGSDREYTYFGPYDYFIEKDGEQNVTEDIPAVRYLSWKLHFDYAPRIGPLPETLVTEDLPALIDLTPHLTDPDDPPAALGFATDREFASIDNATRMLTVTYPNNNEYDAVTITVSDGMRNSTRTLDLMIVPVNDRPVCRRPIPDLEVLEETTLTINLTDHLWDEESGGRLTFACNHEEITVDNELRQASWTPGGGNSSLEAVTFSAWDGQLEGTSNAFNITFIPVNDPPVYIGGLEDATVLEHKNWIVDLDDHFWDEEDPAGLIFESRSPEVTVNIMHRASWDPSGNAGYSIEVIFIAHDARNYSLAAESRVIKLTYAPVNDPPVFLGTLKGARLKAGEEWNITLEDYFKDADTENVRFSSNNPNVKIVELGKTEHCAVWRPDRYSSDVVGLVFTAYDGKTYTRSDPITLDFDAPVEVEEPAPVTNMIQRIPWYIYILLPVGILAGVAAFYAYRKVKYGKYLVEQVFLVNKDGRLLAHKSRKPVPGGGEDIISGMLTALQGFIKEFMRDEKQGELEEMKYGDLKIVIERGKRVYLAVFLSGYVTDGLKALMREILDKVDARMGAVLDSWDGTVKMLEGLDKHLDRLIGEPKAPPSDKK